MTDPERTQALLDIAKIDFEAKQRHWEEKKGYFSDKTTELDLKSTQRFADYYPDPNQLLKAGIVFAHRDLESVATAIDEKKPWAVISGLNPSGPLHFGHKLVFDELLWLQKQGADVYIPITNDESYLVGKAETIGASRRTAHEAVIPSIVSMGFDPQKTHIYVDSDFPDIYNMAVQLSKHLSLSKVFGVFGLGDKSRKKDQNSEGDEDENPGTMFYRGAVQLAQILLPQYDEFGGPKPTLIPVGIDQYPYVLLARDVAKKVGLTPPAALFLKFEHGLDGKGKMSASRPGSSIFLTDDPKVAQKKVRNAYTGGSILADFQREHGGVPGVCPIYHLRTYHFEEDGGKLETQCVRGEILCGECKKIASEQAANFLVDHQARLPEARKRAGDFMLRTPITSFLNKK